MSQGLVIFQDVPLQDERGYGVKVLLTSNGLLQAPGVCTMEPGRDRGEEPEGGSRGVDEDGGARKSIKYIER